MCDPITAVVAAATIGYSTVKVNKMQNKAAQQQTAAIQQAQESIEQAPSFSDMQATALPTIAPPARLSLRLLMLELRVKAKVSRASVQTLVPA